MAVKATAVAKGTLHYQLFPKQALVFKSFEYSVGKGEIARNEQFLLCPQRFSTL